MHSQAHFSSDPICSDHRIVCAQRESKEESIQAHT